MDSTGLGIIARIYSLAKQQNKSFVIGHAPSAVRLVFEITGLDQVLEFSNQMPCITTATNHTLQL